MKRRLVVRGAAGDIIYLPPWADKKGSPIPITEMIALELDITKVDHANPQSSMTVVIEEKCNLGHWHTGDSWDIPPWGNRLD